MALLTRKISESISGWDSKGKRRVLGRRQVFQVGGTQLTEIMCFGRKRGDCGLRSGNRCGALPGSVVFCGRDKKSTINRARRQRQK